MRITLATLALLSLLVVAVQSVPSPEVNYQQRPQQSAFHVAGSDDAHTASLKSSTAADVPHYKATLAGLAKKGITWQPCSGSDNPHWKCASLSVPLDWLNPTADSRKVSLSLVMYQADPMTKSNHTILINPGGPGGSGTSYAWRSAERLSKDYTNHTTDVLGFDPRGVNLTDPHISCWPRDAYRDRWSWVADGMYLGERGDPRANLKILDAYYEATMKGCQERYGDIPRFVTTASVARDMDGIRAALGEEELWYYGVSYGTGLGSTYVEMFPDRVGRVLLDALEDIRDDRTTTGFGTAALGDIDEAYYDGFLGECVRAGPKRCALAKPQDTGDQDANARSGLTMEQLKSRMEKIFRSLIERPAVGYDEITGPGLITYSNLIALLYEALYSAASWPSLARDIVSLESGNTSAIFSRLAGEFAYDPEKEPPKPKSATFGDLFYFVVCGDSYDSSKPDLDWYASLQANMTSLSFIGGESRFRDILPCRHYPYKPNEVYRGDLAVKLRRPILLIAETHDPATPLRNGLRLLEEMTDSNARLIIHDAYGHSSRVYSKCTEAWKQALFLKGQVPDVAKTECKIDDVDRPYPAPKKELQGQAQTSHHQWTAPLVPAFRGRL